MNTYQNNNQPILLDRVLISHIHKINTSIYIIRYRSHEYHYDTGTRGITLRRVDHTTKSDNLLISNDFTYV
jgi:hypothetical protein